MRSMSVSGLRARRSDFAHTVFQLAVRMYHREHGYGYRHQKPDQKKQCADNVDTGGGKHQAQKDPFFTMRDATALFHRFDGSALAIYDYVRREHEHERKDDARDDEQDNADHDNDTDKNTGGEITPEGLRVPEV